MTVYVVTDGRSACVVFTERDQALRYEELSGNRLFEADVREEVAGARFLEDYEAG